MAKRLFHGVYAAVLVPRDDEGNLDAAALTRELEFLLANGIRKFAFNGATGEYCLASLADFRRSLQVAKATLPAEASFLCGIGSARLRETLELGRVGMEAGATGLLAPMPYFFPYAQDDLAAFVKTVASELPAPILLYNLPQFTSELDAITATALIKECSNVVGIKDSSGSLEILRTLTREAVDSSRIIGNDGALAQALTERICDGVVSGVASVLPEIIQALFTNAPENIAFLAAAERLREFIAKINALPIPWGLKAIAEARGLAKAVYQLPVSEQRARQIQDTQVWFKEWITKISESDGVPHTSAV